MSQDSANLNLLRTIAVLLVLFDHTIKFLGFEYLGSVHINWVGRIGVVFFFVHTSLVLMLSLERSKLDGSRLALNFYIRRIFRLFPLSCFFVLFTWLIGIPQASVHPHLFYGMRITPKVLFTNLTLTQNVFGVKDVMGQLWSLPVEWNMYLVLPLLFVLARKWPRKFLWAAWPTAVLLGELYLQHRDLRGLWRLNLLLYAPCFIPGIMAYVLSRRVRRRFHTFLWPVTLCVLVLLFLSRPSWPFTWVIALAVGSSVPFFSDQSNRIVNAATHNIAKYSYGIYLGHTFCIWTAFSFLRYHPWYVQAATFLILVIAIPVICFFLIEQPGIHAGKRLADLAYKLGVQPIPPIPAEAPVAAETVP
jgi:peptidoglycan/LPS O-acetylase OafA/YrhL